MCGPLLRQHIISVLYFDDITHEGDVHETPVSHPIRDRILFVSSEKINILPLLFKLFLASLRRRFKFDFEKK